MTSKGVGPTDFASPEITVRISIILMKNENVDNKPFQFPGCLSSKSTQEFLKLRVGGWASQQPFLKHVGAAPQKAAPSEMFIIEYVSKQSYGVTSFWRELAFAMATSFSLFANSAFLLARAASFFHASQAVLACPMLSSHE